MRGTSAGTVRPWTWVPTLYLAQGLPYAVVMLLSVVLYKRLGISNADIALYTSWLHLPWVIKPLWAPIIDLAGHLRRWVWGLQGLMAAVLASMPLALASEQFFAYSLSALWLLAFASATHDAAADGLYIESLDAREQAAFVGIRNAFWRAGMLFGQGGLVLLGGTLEGWRLSVVQAWSVVFVVVAMACAVLAGHHAWRLPNAAAPHGASSEPTSRQWRAVLSTAGRYVADFFRRDDIACVLAFLLLYRFGEAQLLKLVVPFLMDTQAAGGLGLSTRSVGVLYGGIGVACLLAGGVLGGWAIARAGLRRMMWPMVALTHLPNLLFVALALAQPGSTTVIAAALAFEQFGYGFGFTAYTVYTLRVAAGAGTAAECPRPTSHYALCTGLMALGMMLPGLWSGALQAALGYVGFFAWVCAASLVSVVVVAWCMRRQRWLAE